MNFSMLSSFALYFITLIGIGIYYSKKSSSADNFILGNRSVNYWVTAIAAQTSDMGVWLFMGYPAVIYTRGLFEAWTAIGLIIGMFCAWHFVAPRLRIGTQETDSITLPSFFASRCSDPYNLIRLTGAALIIYFSAYYIATGLLGLSLLFKSAFNLNYHVGIILSLITASLYTLLGGFVGIAWCDFYQGLFLLGTIILVPLYGFYALPNGIIDITTHAINNSISLSLLASPYDTLNAFLIAAGWGLGYFGQPHILMNFMGIDNVDQMHRAKWIGMAWQILVLTAATALGFVGMGIFTNGLPNPELIFITMTTQLFSPFIAGLILCAIIAAVLSTVDSLILASGSTIAQDLAPALIGKNLSEKTTMFISRIGALCIAATSLYIAWDDTQSVFKLVEYAWSGFGSSFGPLLLVLLFTNIATWIGALSGMIVGSITVMLWPYELSLVPGFFFGLITIFVVSYITRKDEPPLSSIPNPFWI